MVRLDLREPTLIRDFTYYDRAAILLTPEEMTSQRVRISSYILGTPISRSLNFKYSYPKEFYGYVQAFWRNTLTNEFTISYPEQYLWDYWNEHSTIAHQLSSVFQRLSLFNQIALDYFSFVSVEGSPLQQALEAAKLEQSRLALGLTDDNSLLPLPDIVSTNDVVNTFIHPFDLIRFKFPFGTIFAVRIESWSLGDTFGGSPVELPNEDPDYPTTNPSGDSPAQTPGASNPLQPYGNAPPPSSPIDPRLDPNDFSNAPPPPTGGGTRSVQGWQIPAIPGQQIAGVAVGCPGATIDISLGYTTGIQNAVSLGVVAVTADANGRVLGSDVLTAFPGFVFGDNIFAPDARCGVTGTF